MTRAVEQKRKPHIVLIEDSAGDVVLIKWVMQRHAIECDLTQFQDGEAAMTALSPEADTPLKPDLILLDLNLPRRDGIEVLKAARENASLDTTPIAVITSSFSPRDREEVMGLGAATFIIKPTNLEQFIDEVGGALAALLARAGASAAP